MNKAWIVALLSFLVFACADSNQENEAWIILEKALIESNKGNFMEYINNVDSNDVNIIGKNNLMDALKQRAVNLHDSVVFICEHINQLDSSTLLIKYKFINNINDTTFCIQKMKKYDNLWKIKII
jgi:hypothetical protein